MRAPRVDEIEAALRLHAKMQAANLERCRFGTAFGGQRKGQHGEIASTEFERQQFAETLAGDVDRALRIDQCRRAARAAAHVQQPLIALDELQTGRASYRERVCQYV